MQESQGLHFNYLIDMCRKYRDKQSICIILLVKTQKVISLIKAA